MLPVMLLAPPVTCCYCGWELRQKFLGIGLEGLKPQLDDRNVDTIILLLMMTNNTEYHHSYSSPVSRRRQLRE